MIEGKKVIICGLTKECVPEILKWVNQPELKQFTGTLYPVSDFEHEEWIARRAKSLSDKLFLIKDKLTGQNIGTIGLKEIDFVNSNGELFVCLGNLDYVSGNRGGGVGE